MAIFAMFYLGTESRHRLGALCIPKIKDSFLPFPKTIGKNWDSSEPKCGFSKQTLAILEGLKADFGTFDILADEDVRQVGWLTGAYFCLYFFVLFKNMRHSFFLSTCVGYRTKDVEKFMSRNCKSFSTLVQFNFLILVCKMVIPHPD
jgi:hypothetical protein